MRKLGLSLSLIALMGLAACYSVPEKIKLGVTKLNAAAKLMSVHNAAHCKKAIAELEMAIASTADGETYDGDIDWLRGTSKTDMASMLDNEKTYHRANEILPDTTQELEDWAFEKELGDD